MISKVRRSFAPFHSFSIFLVEIIILISEVIFSFVSVKSQRRFSVDRKLHRSFARSLSTWECIPCSVHQSGNNFRLSATARVSRMVWYGMVVLPILHTRFARQRPAAPKATISVRMSMHMSVHTSNRISVHLPLGTTRMFEGLKELAASPQITKACKWTAG